MAPNPTRDGTITLVQERRFQLVDDGGTAHLFLLAHDAPLDALRLAPLAGSGRRVRVEYRKVPDLIAHVAQNVCLLQPEETG